METEIYSGDVAVVKEVDLKEINKNDIIAFKEESSRAYETMINKTINPNNGDKPPTLRKI